MEIALVTHLQAQLAAISDHYRSSHGRVKKTMLEGMQSLIDGRMTVLDEYDAATDVAEAQTFAETLDFAKEVKGLVDQMFDSYQSKGARVSIQLVQQLEKLVDARAEALEEEEKAHEAGMAQNH